MFSDFGLHCSSGDKISKIKASLCLKEATWAVLSESRKAESKLKASSTRGDQTLPLNEITFLILLTCPYDPYGVFYVLPHTA